MLLPSEIRIGIIYADDYHSVPFACEELYRCGCRETNIQIKRVACDLDIPLGVLFFAEYTEVDGVVVISNATYNGEIARSIMDLQIQWNMPVEYCYAGGAGVSESCRGVIEMIQLQGNMADNVPEEHTPTSRRESIN